LDCAVLANIPISLIGRRLMLILPFLARRSILALNSGLVQDLVPAVSAKHQRYFRSAMQGAYDHEDDVTYLQADQVRIVDIGDADIIHTDTIQSHANIEAGVRADPCRWRSASGSWWRSFGKYSLH
jgi:hypothetical protein